MIAIAMQLSGAVVFFQELERQNKPSFMSLTELERKGEFLVILLQFLSSVDLIQPSHPISWHDHIELHT